MIFFMFSNDFLEFYRNFFYGVFMVMEDNFLFISSSLCVNRLSVAKKVAVGVPGVCMMLGISLILIEVRKR